MNDFHRPSPPLIGPFQARTARSVFTHFRIVRPLMLAAALLPLTFSLQACQSPAQQAAELASQAEAFANAGNLVAARQAIVQALGLREDVPAYYALRGNIAVQMGDPVGAYRAYTRVLDFDATNQMALAYVANLGAQVGQVQEAEDAADRLLALDPNAMPALQVKGMLFISREKYDEAEKIGDKMLGIRPSDEGGTIIKARALAKQGKVEEALALLDGASVINSDSPALLTNKLNMYRNLRQPEKMAEMLDKLVALKNGGSATNRLDQVNLLYRLGKTDQARQAALALLEAGSRDPDDYRKLQRLWWEFDKTPFPAGASSDASHWKDPLALVLTARYLLTRGDVATANALLRTASPAARPLIPSLQARVLLGSGQEGKAREQIDALLAKDTHDVDALLMRAQIAANEGKRDAAVEAAQLAMTNDPLDPETYVVSARLFKALGADWRARQVFEDGLKNLPQNFLLLENFTQFLHDSDDKGRAVSAARAFARATPSSVRAWTILAVQCQWAGDQACLQNALAGRKNAETTYLVDNPPGTPPNRGLFGPI